MIYFKSIRCAPSVILIEFTDSPKLVSALRLAQGSDD